MHAARLYFDFISPYAWLALEQMPAFLERTGARIELRPVVYGALLDATGLVGPVETEAKRRYTFDDVVRCATRLGLPVVGPPTHPFRSLEALRAVLLHAEDPRVLELARTLAAACWSEGRDLADGATLAQIVGYWRGAALDVETLAAELSQPAVKNALRTSTEEALAAGVFGVPTFEFEGELFWGHDRIPHLEERLAGTLAPARSLSAALIERPAALQRKR